MSVRSNAIVILAATVLAAGIVPSSYAADAANPAPTTQPAGVSGTYKWTTQGPQGDMEFTFTLKQEGDKLTGTFSGFGDDTEIKDGKVSASGEISFKVIREFGGRDMVTTYTCKVVDGELKGKSEMVMARDFTAKKVQ